MSQPRRASHEYANYIGSNDGSTTNRPTRQNFGGPFHHSFQGGHNLTNAGIPQRRHSEQLHGGGGGGGGLGGGGGGGTNQSPLTNSSHSSATGTSNTIPHQYQRLGGHKSPTATSSALASHKTGSSSSRPATGPVRGQHEIPRREMTRERSSSVEILDDEPETMEMEDGLKMRDVDGDAVIISMNSSHQAPGAGAGGTAGLVRRSLSSVRTSLSPPPASPSHDNTTTHPSFMRQGSGSSYTSSGDLQSGRGIVGQPESSQFPSRHEEGKAKALPGEGSIDMKAYQRAISRTSSSGSSYDPTPPRQHRTSATTACSEDLKEDMEEQVMKLAESLSTAEGEKEKLRKEKEKLERKLKEAEDVAAQAGTAALEVSRLESELKKEKASMMELLHVRQSSPEGGNHSIQLSQELDLMRARLENEVLAREAVEQEMMSLKQSLVVGGERHAPQSSVVIGKLRDRVRELEETVDHLRRSLEEKEDGAKRQNHVQSRTISDLQHKLSRERQQREEMKKTLAENETNTSGQQNSASKPDSPDVSALTAEIREKEKVILGLSQKLQSLDKTARDVTKIAVHSKQQSEKVVNLRQELTQAQEGLKKREEELTTAQEEMNQIRTHYDNALRTKTAELAKKTGELKKMREEMEGLKSQLESMEETEVRWSESEVTRQKLEKECNHWKQKSVQQDMVLHTKNQEMEGLHREVNGLKSTVSAQVQEVERLQRQNKNVRGEIETHRVTAMTYKEDFESERRDREAVHTKIAEMESRYRHQLEAIGDQLKKVTEEKEGHRQTVTKTEALLHQQRQQMMGQLQEREVEMSSTLQNIQKLQEEVMSKTQQVKQYKKQIDQLSAETQNLKTQENAYKSQIEFFAKRTDEYGRQRTFKEIQERKLAQLESQCDQLRAENNELRAKLDHSSSSSSSSIARTLQSRTPHVKSPAITSSSAGPHHGVLLPSKLVASHPGQMAPSANQYPPATRQPPPSPLSPSQSHNYSNKPGQQSITGPYQSSLNIGSSSGSVSPHHLTSSLPQRQGAGVIGVTGQARSPQYLLQDSPYSSLPGSGLGGFGVGGGAQYQQQRPGGMDPSLGSGGPVGGIGYSTPAAGEAAERDSPPSSNVGLLVPQPQQRRARSQIQIHQSRPGGNSQNYPPPPPHPSSHSPVHSRAPNQHQPPPNIYSNLPLSNTTIPSNNNNIGSQQQQQQARMYNFGGQRSNSVQQPPTTRPPPQGMEAAGPSRRGSWQPTGGGGGGFSTPAEETRRRYPPNKPQLLEGYIKPQQASSTRPPLPPPQHRTHPSITNRPSSISSSSAPPPPPSTSCATADISSGIDSVIEETASKVREEEAVGDGDDGEGIPYDPNLVCPKCRMRFREGEIQKFRRHVSSAH